MSTAPWAARRGSSCGCWARSCGIRPRPTAPSTRCARRCGRSRCCGWIRSRAIVEGPIDPAQGRRNPASRCASVRSVSRAASCTTWTSWAGCPSATARPSTGAGVAPRRRARVGLHPGRLPAARGWGTRPTWTAGVREILPLSLAFGRLGAGPHLRRRRVGAGSGRVGGRERPGPVRHRAAGDGRHRTRRDPPQGDRPAAGLGSPGDGDRARDGRPRRADDRSRS